jgi:CheY-like chemotaxis protein
VGMKGRRILFYDPNPKVLRVAERALISTGSEVDVAADERTLLQRIELNGYDLLMINYDPPMRSDPKWAKLFEKMDGRFPKTRLVLHATASSEDYLPLMAEHRFVRNLIAKNDEPLDPEELIVTAEKLLRNDLFGIDKYMLWGVEPYRVEIRDSRQKLAYVREVSGYAERLGCNERTIELIETVVDELSTNAIYNAPRDADGNARYAKLSRREPVVLEESEIGILEFACDGNYIAISQVDPFGALTHETIVSYLNRCLVKGPEQFTNASGGAGIGLYRVFQSLSKFIVNIQPGRRTEVISLIDLRLSMKRFRTLPKSFHIFVADAAANAATGQTREGR